MWLVFEGRIALELPFAYSASLLEKEFIIRIYMEFNNALKSFSYVSLWFSSIIQNNQLTTSMTRWLIVCNKTLLSFLMISMVTRSNSCLNIVTRLIKKAEGVVCSGPLGSDFIKVKKGNLIYHPNHIQNKYNLTNIINDDSQKVPTFTHSYQS